MSTDKYWDQRYLEENTPWDLLALSPPIKSILDLLDDPDKKILIPGAGRGYEAGYAYELGYKHTHYADISQTAAKEFSRLFPEFPKDQILTDDFFKLEGKYDLIIEQTFFCSMDPSMRKDYVKKCYELLNEGGYIKGLLFASEFEREGPPFGGNMDQYRKLFSALFAIERLEMCKTSVLPRLGNELIFSFKKI